MGEAPARLPSDGLPNLVSGESGQPELNRAGIRFSCRVRKRFGRDAPNSLTRMDPAPGFGRPASAGFGMGSVGEGGSVGVAKNALRFFGFLQPKQAVSCLENPRVDGSIPSLATTSNGVYSDHMVYISFRAHG